MLRRVGILVAEIDVVDDDIGRDAPEAPEVAAVIGAILAKNFEATDGAVGAIFHEAATEGGGAVGALPTVSYKEKG